jgi:hypothetical protein
MIRLVFDFSRSPYIFSYSEFDSVGFATVGATWNPPIDHCKNDMDLKGKFRLPKFRNSRSFDSEEGPQGPGQALRKNEKESAFQVLQVLTKIGLKKSNESCPSSVWANLWHREISRHVHWKFIQSLENRRYPTVHLLNMTVAKQSCLQTTQPE